MAATPLSLDDLPKEIDVPLQSDEKASAVSAATKEDVAYPKGIKLALILSALLLTELLVGLEQTIVATATATIGNEFKSLKEIGWYGSAYLLTSCTLQPMFGRMYTFFPQKWVFLSAVTIFQVASVVSATAQSSAILIVGRALQGLGYAGIFIGCLSISSVSLPVHAQALFTSLMGAAYGTGAALGPVLGGIITSKLSWRWCFWINLPPGCLSLFIIAFYCNPPIAPQPLPIRQRLVRVGSDAVGALVLTAGATCLLLALQDGGIAQPWNSGMIIGLLVGFILLTIVFFVGQYLLKENASLSMRVLKNRNIAALFVLNATVGATYYSVLYAEPLYFQAIRGSTPAQSGVECLPTIIPMVLASILAGWLILRFRTYHYEMLLGTIFSAVGSGALATFKATTPVGQWVGIQLICGIGLGTSYMLAYIASQALLPAKDRPAGASLVVFIQLFGATIWVSASQAIYQNKLLSGISRIPGLDIVSVIDSGVSEFRHVVPVELLPAVVEAAVSSLYSVFMAVGIIASVGVLAVFVVEWRRIE